MLTRSNIHSAQDKLAIASAEAIVQRIGLLRTAISADEWALSEAIRAYHHAHGNPAAEHAAAAEVERLTQIICAEVLSLKVTGTTR